ncbi:hypothetical protein MTYM_00426 [Methylococcales bacterium]|nr:hypothetical protein MTYM_00426 [Methylococcales bacterium]
MRSHPLFGFSLIELIITMTIGVILLGSAMPSLTSGIVSNRLTSNANDLVVALNFARSEAIKRGQHVVIRKVGENWENGWQVFVDIDRTTEARKNLLDAGTDVELRMTSALPDRYTLRGNNNFVSFIRYQPDGTSNRFGSFAICEGGNIRGAKLVIVNSVGRARMAPDADHDGVPEKEDGSEIGSCTSGF